MNSVDFLLVLDFLLTLDFQVLQAVLDFQVVQAGLVHLLALAGPGAENTVS